MKRADEVSGCTVVVCVGASGEPLWSGLCDFTTPLLLERQIRVSQSQADGIGFGIINKRGILLENISAKKESAAHSATCRHLNPFKLQISSGPIPPYVIKGDERCHLYLLCHDDLRNNDVRSLLNKRVCFFWSVLAGMWHFVPSWLNKEPMFARCVSPGGSRIGFSDISLGKDKTRRKPEQGARNVYNNNNNKNVQTDFSSNALKWAQVAVLYLTLSQ